MSVSQRSYAAGFHAAWFALMQASGAPGTTYLNIGNTQSGWRFKRTKHVRKIQDDSAGEATIDVISAGTDIELHGVMIQALLVRASGMLWALEGVPLIDATAPAAYEGNFNNDVGMLGSFTFGSLCLVPNPNTQAYNLIAAQGACYIFKYAACVNDLEQLLGSGLNEVPATFMVLPDPNNSNKLYTVSALPSGVTYAPGV